MDRKKTLCVSAVPHFELVVGLIKQWKLLARLKKDSIPGQSYLSNLFLELMTAETQIKKFLDGSPFAVVGASQNRNKFGNKVLRWYQQNDRQVYPINPVADSIEGLEVYASLLDLPEKPHGVSIITPPAVTEKVVQQAIELGIENIWMQPGAENDIAIATANEAGINIIASGPCILLVRE